MTWKILFAISMGKNSLFCMVFVANFTRFPTAQKFWKSVNIWQSYRECKGGNFFETQCSLLYQYPTSLPVWTGKRRLAVGGHALVSGWPEHWLSNHKLESALTRTVWSQCTPDPDRQTDGRTNIMTLARWFVLTNWGTDRPTDRSYTGKCDDYRPLRSESDAA